jgi:glutathione S-transferase
MSNPTLHGPGFSTYVRSVRITLAEKGVVYDLNEFNFLEGWPDG